MTNPPSSARALRWALPVAGILGAALVFVLLRPSPAPEPTAQVAPKAAPAAPSAVARTEPAPAPAPAAKPSLPAGEVYVEGQGLATVVPAEPNASVPPPADGPEDDPSVNPPIEPEKPQTPEWKLEKTTRIAGLMSNRISRLEARVKELEAKGDPAALEEQRVLLERNRKRRAELDVEMAALREQIRANGGTPTVAGQPTP